MTDDPCIPVRELAELAGYTSEYLYLLARRGQLKLQPHRKGVLLTEALAWMKVHSREAKKAARADVVRSLKAALAKDGA